MGHRISLVLAPFFVGGSPCRCSLQCILGLVTMKGTKRGPVIRVVHPCGVTRPRQDTLVSGCPYNQSILLVLRPLTVMSWQIWRISFTENSNGCSNGFTTVLCLKRKSLNTKGRSHSNEQQLWKGCSNFSRRVCSILHRLFESETEIPILICPILIL